MINVLFPGISREIPETPEKSQFQSIEKFVFSSKNRFDRRGEGVPPSKKPISPMLFHPTLILFYSFLLFLLRFRHSSVASAVNFAM